MSQPPPTALQLWTVNHKCLFLSNYILKVLVNLLNRRLFD
jgi:hypothetical protein